MCKFKDLTGERFGKLVVLNNEPNLKSHSTRWKCKCDCGNIVIVYTSSLKSGATQSCGCLWKKKISKHNMYGTRIYCIYDGMKTRCYNKNFKRYKDYGGRGIKICNEWNDKENGFMNFYNWAINNGYRDDLTIDRINNNGNYEPNNCRWVDIKTQANNKTNNFFVTFDNETHTISEWSKILKINKQTLRSRFSNGWNIEKSLTTLVRKKGEIENEAFAYFYCTNTRSYIFFVIYDIYQKNKR